MPFPIEVRHTLAEAVAESFVEVHLKQAIFNVRVTPLATGARIRFDTAFPAFATVDIFRMVHGVISLDMEKEHLVCTEMELFGSARTRHSIRIRGLEQERRFWYRISVPRRSPHEPNATGRIRLRGEFATKRRYAEITIERIHIHKKTDPNAAELTFQTACYDATVARGRRLTEPVRSDEVRRSDGESIDSPYGDHRFALERAPDRIGVYVVGVDDDTPGFPWPGQGLGMVGTRPPDRMPEAGTAISLSAMDMSSALGAIDLENIESTRFTFPFSFMSASGALRFEVHARVFVWVNDTLGPRATRPWRLIVDPKRLKLTRDERQAGMVGLLDGGRLALALSDEGRLSRREEASGGAWAELDSPPFERLLVHPARDGGQLLAGLDGEGRLHVAAVTDPRREAPRWRALGPTGDLPLTVEGPDGGMHLLWSDGGGGLWHARAESQQGVVGEPRMIAEGLDGRPIAAADGAGRLLAAFGRGRELHLAVVDRNGELAERMALGERFPVALAIVDDADEGVVIVAGDGEDRVAARRAARPGEDWDVIGPIDELLEGPIEAARPEGAEPVAAQTA